jgi:ankyrin repeat protein
MNYSVVLFEQHDIDVRQLLAENKAAMYAVDDNGFTWLSRAVQNGHEPAVQRLFEHGASVNTVDRHGLTPLLHAIVGHNIVLQLVEHGASVNTADKHGRTPISFVAHNRYSHNYIIQQLVEHGASVNIFDEHGCKPLY